MFFTPGIGHADMTENSKPDEKGYWELNAGAFDAYNRNGDYYPLTPAVKQMFQSSSSFMRRLREKKMFGEWFHPKQVKGMRLSEWLQRVCDYDADRICLFISNLRMLDGKDLQGRPIKLVKARTRPFGDKADIFESSLRDPEMNTALSVRSITDTYPLANGKLRREVTTLWCYDAVPIQGIDVADKANTHSFESYDFTREELAQALQSRPAMSEYTAMEGAEEMRTQVLTDLGWETVTVPSANMNWLSNN